ncbi:hypothetical protein CRM22_003305 [Opisthorchis felineus]|uniref:Uncharacterized protein n=1 Tax=Opisthorchis felineus TaxID=147828 RepID=A0A4S2M831_OPIFE|nr:hypothetical protein CRM22_003305 [Opisthorchis felineus]
MCVARARCPSVFRMVAKTKRVTTVLRPSIHTTTESSQEEWHDHPISQPAGFIRTKTKCSVHVICLRISLIKVCLDQIELKTLVTDSGFLFGMTDCSCQNQIISERN